MRPTLTQAELKELLYYNPENGDFTWRKNTGRRKMIGKIAGSDSRSSRKPHTFTRRIVINNKRYIAGRLAFLYMTGSIPECVGHKDHDSLNIRWDNLFHGNQGDVSRNSKLFHTNNSGITGVSPPREKYIVSIWVNSASLPLGGYDDFFEACCARKSAENKHGFHANHGTIRPL